MFVDHPVARAHMCGGRVEGGGGCCLAVGRRRERKGLSPVRESSGELMFADIGMMEINVMGYKVLKAVGLIDFFDAGRQADGATTTPARE